MTKKYEKYLPLVFISFSFLIIVVFYFYPMLRALMLSMQSGKGVNMHFSGIENYQRLFTDQVFKQALFNTFLFLIIQVPLMLFLGIISAVILNDENLKFKTFFRGAIFIPCVTSLVAYSIIFKNIFATEGLVNQLLVSFNITNEGIPWLSEPFWARFVIILAITWRWTGYNMIFFLSGLQTIDKSIFEAAKIDGANAFRQFKSITLPLLKPIILFTSITSTIGTLQLFDEVKNITDGNPGNATTTLSLYIYNISFKYTPDFGYAATVSFVIVLIIVVLSFIQLKIGGDKIE